MKALVLGSEDVILSFKAVGVDGRVVSTPEEMAEELDKTISSGEYQIIMVEENLALSIEKKINEHRKKSEILIVEVSSPNSDHEGIDFQEFIKKVLGVKV